MGETDALSRFILGSGPAEQVENALMVLLIDAPAVVRDLKDRKAELGAAPNGDFAGNPGLEVFDRIVDQVGEDLLQPEPVAHDARQRFDMDLGLRFHHLMRYGRRDRLDQLARIDPFRLELAPSLAGP